MRYSIVSSNMNGEGFQSPQLTQTQSLSCTSGAYDKNGLAPCLDLKRTVQHRFGHNCSLSFRCPHCAPSHPHTARLVRLTVSLHSNPQLPFPSSSGNNVCHYTTVLLPFKPILYQPIPNILSLHNQQRSETKSNGTITSKNPPITNQ